MPRRLAAFAVFSLLAPACVDDTTDLPTPDAVDAGEDGVRVDAGLPSTDAGLPPEVVDAGCQPASCQQLGAECGVVDDGCGGNLDCGVCGTWTPMSMAGAPGIRRLGATVFDGEGLVLWGGTDGNGPPSPVGARYHMGTDTWTAISTVDAPPATLGACAVRYGDDVLVFGGTDLASPTSERTNQGGLYDPQTDTWRPFPLGGAPSARSSAGCGVLGDLFIVAGGAFPEDNSGAALDLRSWTWQPIATPPIGLSFPKVVTGPDALFFSGAPWLRFDLQGGWQSATTDDSPSRRLASGLAWAEDGFYLFGGVSPGGEQLDDFYFYDVARDDWRALGTTDGPPAGGPLVTGWTGEALLVFGCSSGCRGGYHYEASTATWRPMPYNRSLNRLRDAVGAWTGEELLVVPAGPGVTGEPVQGWRYRP